MKFYEKNFRKLYLIEERKLDDTTFYAKVKLSPYQRGQGITVANTLRRILLNEIDCIAIESAQIKGVSHEFTVKPGIRESIPEILSNLRKISFRSISYDNLLQVSENNERVYSTIEEKNSKMKLLPRKLLNLFTDFTNIAEVKSLKSLKKANVTNLPSTINPFTGCFTGCYDKHTPIYNSAYNSLWCTTDTWDAKAQCTQNVQEHTMSSDDTNTTDMGELTDSNTVYYTLINTNHSIDNFKILTKCKKTTPGTLYAEDIPLPIDIQCVAPKQKIATLVSPHTSLHLNIILVRSKQYSQKSPHENMQILDFTNNTCDTEVTMRYHDSHSVNSMQAHTNLPMSTDATSKQSLKHSEYKANPTIYPYTGIKRDKYKNEKAIEYSHICSYEPITASNTVSGDSSSDVSAPIYEHEESTEKLNNSVMNSPFLPIDTIFNPVKKINYSIHQESYNNTNQESIFLEIWTDGSSYPLESLAKASLVMRQLFQPFTF